MASFEKNKSWSGGAAVPTVTEDDGTQGEVVRAELQGYDSSNLVWRRVAVDATGQVKTTGGGGGGASTIADGADIAEGATTDGAVVTDTSGTVSGKLRGLVKWAFERMPASLGQKTMALSLPVVLSSDQSSIPVTLGAGSAVVGHVIVDTAPTTAVTGPLTDTQLRAVAVPVSGFGTFHVDDNAGSITVDNAGTFAVQAAVSGSVSVSNFPATQIVDGSAVTQPVSDSIGNSHLSAMRASLNDLAFAAILESERSLFQ